MANEILVERTGARAEVVLNRPERRNALTGPLVTALRDALTELGADVGVHVLVIRGAGGAFCSGLDLKEFNADPAPEWLSEFQSTWRAVQVALFRFPGIVVSALEKFAINGGGPLALGADHLIVGETAYLQVGEIQQGVNAAMNVAWLRLRFNEALAARVALTGQRLSGPELLRLGIATEVVPDDQVVERARMLADQLAAFPSAGARALKRSIRALGPTQDPEAWFAAAASGPRPLGRGLGAVHQ